MKHSRIIPRYIRKRITNRMRMVYFFGYGADASPELIRAITGHKPRVIGEAVLDNYKLCVQELHEVTTKGINPQNILAHAWNNDFKSYVIMPQDGAQVKGTLYRIRLNDRHDIDAWEMVSTGWYNKLFTNVRLLGNGKIICAETQVLAPGQTALNEADGLHYPHWLIDKSRLLAKATSLRQQFNW